MRKYKEQIWHVIFLITACVSIAAVLIICFFLFTNGSAAFGKIGLWNFISGTKWKPLDDSPLFGILPMIVGSLYVTAGAIAIGVPIGLLFAIFMAKFCPAWLHKILKPITGLLAGIPSIVYAFFGAEMLVPLMLNVTSKGKNILTASILLGVMILPTIIEVSESAIRAVPESYYEGSRALGASHERSTFSVMVPAAKSGVLAGVVLGIGRAIGETMAVIWVAGNQPRMPKGLLKGVRTMTANIILDMGYAVDLHRDALFATAVVLFIFILMINACLAVIKRKGDMR